MEKYLLLNPGPVNLSDRVRKALLRPDLCHREQEFIDLQNNIRQKLLSVYQLPENQWAAVLLTGSGTAAVESMLTSLVPNNGHVLIIENGVYGERIAKMAETYRIQHTCLHYDWEDTVTIDELAKKINQLKITHVAVIHHETTTGRLNDIDAIAQVCSARNIPILLDGVSSFGAETLKFDKWNIAACAGTANKCLHGVPGTCFVIVRRKILEQSTVTPRTLYLDLNNYLQQQDANSTPFTQSVQCLYALDEGLDELGESGGWQQRQQKYQQNMKIIRTGMLSLGIKPLLDEAECSCVLHAYHLPENITYQTLHNQLKSQGFIIYAGQGDLSKTIFRVSAMGAITNDDMQRFVSEMEKIVR